LRALLGIRCEEFDAPAAGEPLVVDLDLGGIRKKFVAGKIAEIAVCETAEAVGNFTSGVLSGRPAITSHEYGAGRAWYLATSLDHGSLVELFADLLEVPAARVREREEGIERIPRFGERGEPFEFAINHSREPFPISRLSPPVAGANATNRLCPQDAEIPPRDFAILDWSQPLPSDR
jgi:beta-galactosidase